MHMSRSRACRLRRRYVRLRCPHDRRTTGAHQRACGRWGLRALRCWARADLPAHRHRSLRVRRSRGARRLRDAARACGDGSGDTVRGAGATVRPRARLRARRLRRGRHRHLRRPGAALPGPRVDDRMGGRHRRGGVCDSRRDRRHLRALELRLPGPAAFSPGRERGLRGHRRRARPGTGVLRDRARGRPRARLGVAPRALSLRSRPSGRRGRRGRRALRRGARRDAGRPGLRARRRPRDAGCARGSSGGGSQCQHGHLAGAQRAPRGSGRAVRPASVDVPGRPGARGGGVGHRERSRRRLGARPGLPRRGAWLALAAVAFAAAVPFLSLPGVRLDALADTVYLAVAATALGLTIGAAGLPSLGTGAYMAIGAFTSVSGGSQGLIVPQRSLLGLVPTPAVHFEVALVLLVLAALAIAAVRRGAPGLELSALRQAPALATSLGVGLGRRRLGALSATAALAGLAGGLSVELQAVADPAGYDPFLSFKLLVAVLLGGAAATLGPAVGVGALGAIGLVSGPLARLLHLPLDRFDAAVAAILLVFVLALGGSGIVPWLMGLRRQSRRRAPEKAPLWHLNEPAPDASVLRASGLRKAFGGVVAVEALSLELPRGETTALIGPNGSGKTTVLRLISGAAVPDAGAVSFAGHDITRASTAERVRLGIARTLQTTAGFTELTALENVLVGRGARRRYDGLLRTALATPRARSEAKAAEAAALEGLALVGLDGVADVPAPELTSSQRRLLALAAALATEPEVLLVDELAAGAATDELEGLAAVVARIRARGLALLVVEHNLQLVRQVADRVLVLAAGSVVADGTVAEIAGSPVVQQGYLGGQRL